MKTTPDIHLAGKPLVPEVAVGDEKSDFAFREGP